MSVVSRNGKLPVVRLSVTCNELNAELPFASK